MTRRAFVGATAGARNLARDGIAAMCLLYGGAPFADEPTAKRPSVEQLVEIGLPTPVSYVPQTWGWAALAALLTLAIAAWGLRALWRWHQNRYRRDALQCLDQIEQAATTHTEALRELPELLKRVALSMPGNPAVATLRDEAWQQFLQQHSQVPLPADFSQRLAQLAYGPTPANLDTRHLLQLSRQWVEHHHVAA